MPVYGAGSLQQYIDYDPEYHYFNFSDDDKQRLRPVVLFDLLVNNADRKGSHVLIEKETRKLWAIDHGLCFHEENKLRTVLWDFAGQPIAADLLGCVASVPGLLSGRSELHTALAPLLELREMEAMALRARRLVQAGVFPPPPRNRRAFPYPPV